MNKWMNEWMNEWMNQSINKLVICSFIHSFISGDCGWKAYATFDFLWNYALPVGVFVYCYSRIFHTIRHQSKVVSSHVGRGQNIAMTTTSRDQNAGQIQQQATGTTTSTKLSHTELNILQAMITVIICFILCWSPSSLTSVILSLKVW